MRINAISAGALAAALFCSGQSSAQLTSTLADDAAAFGVRESVISIDLSPDGRSIVYVAPVGDTGSAAFIADVTTGATTGLVKSGSGPERLSWCAFITDERLICRYRVTVSDAGKLIPFSRLIALNRDGSKLRQLGQRESYYDARLRQFDGEVIDWLPGQGGSVLMAREYIPEEGRVNTLVARSKEGYGVDRIDTASLKSKTVEAPKQFANGYLTDGQGNVRLMAIEERVADLLTGRTKYLYRTQGSRDWRMLSDYVAADTITPLAIDAACDCLYALKPLNGRQALYRIRLTDPTSAELVASHPRVDLEGVQRSANGQKVIGYTLVEDRRDTIYFDPEYKALVTSLSEAIPNLPIMHFAGASLDGRKVLIMASADDDPGRYFIFDKASRQLNEVMLARPQLEGRKLASVESVRVTSADGTAVPAYLTLPVGKEAKNLPAVVLPHGGPSSRDEWGFDWLAQFLAGRGYAVLQPNYRGSGGFGDAWLVENGFKSWRTSIGDIVASAKWLASEGIADGNRIAIVGWSYGGYAALQSAAIEPGLFKSVAAVAPVTDLAMLKREAKGYTSSRLVEDFVGSGPHIREGSPLQRAAQIRVPVLLVHGDKDENVGVDESVQMEAALRAGGTPVQFLRYRHLDHQLDDSAARREMLTRIAELLHKTIGQ